MKAMRREPWPPGRRQLIRLLKRDAGGSPDCARRSTDGHHKVKRLRGRGLERDKAQPGHP
jgi:hypothetical protein